MPKAKKAKVEATRPILYSEIVANVCVGTDAITLEQTIALMGFTTDAAAAEAAGCESYLFTDLNGAKVYATNNLHNRPLYMGVVETLIQEQLNSRWRFNGEPLIIGKTGRVLNGQHTLSAHYLADQHRQKEAHRWSDKHPGPMVLEKLVVFGVDEDDGLINTMDTCKPRSLSDVIYRSEYFAKMKPADRRVAAKMMDNALRLLWHRTGACNDSFAPRRTHAEALDWVTRHPRLLRCIKHIQAEYAADWSVHNKRFGAGNAAALLYLMASRESDGDMYRNADPPSEKKLDWTYWDRACEFWVLLCQGSAEVRAVWFALGALVDETTGEGGGTRAEKLAIILKGWSAFAEGRAVKDTDVRLEYVTDDDGIRQLGETPIAGGIDIGNPKEHAGGSNEDVPAPAEPTTADAEADSAGPATGDPTPEEIEARKVEERKRRAEEILKRREAAKTAANGTSAPPTPPNHPMMERAARKPKLVRKT